MTTVMPDINSINSWTSADYALLTADFISQMTTSQIQAMVYPERVPVAAVSGFTAAQMPYLASLHSCSAKWINNLSLPALQGMTPGQFYSVTRPVLCLFDDAHLAALTAAQVAYTNKLDGLTARQFGLLNISGMSASQISSWSQTQVSAFTAQQISSLSNTQIQALKNPTDLSAAAITGFNATQLPAIPLNFSQFSATWLCNLTVSAFQGITTSQVSQITAATLTALDSDHLTAFTATQVNSLADLTPLSSAQFGLLNISALSVSTTANLTQTEYAGLTNQQISTLSPAQIQSLQDPEWLGSGVDFSQLPVTFINNLSVAALQKLSAAQLNALSTSTLANLDNAHLAALTADQVNSMTHLSALSSQQLGIINLSGQSVSAIGSWSLNQYATLTAQQIASLSAAQIQALQHPEWIPVAAVNGLSAAQMPAISLNFSQFSSSWLNSLNVSALQALSAAQLNQISPATLNTLNDVQLSALTASQVGAMTNLSALSNLQLGLLNISGQSVANITGWTQANYATLSAQQIASLSSAQIQAVLQHPDWVPVSAISGLTAGQISALATDFSVFQAAFINGLSSQALQAITATQLNQLTTSALTGLDNTHLSALTAAQVNAMTHLTVLSSAQFGLLDLSGLSTSAIAALTQTEYAGITAQQMLTLSSAQIQAMQHPEWLPASSQDFSQIPASVLNNMSLVALQALSVSQLNQISVQALSGLDDAHLSALSASQVSGMTHLAALSAYQQGLINISWESVAQITGWSQDQYATLSSQQIASLTAPQVQAVLLHPDWIPAAAIGGFTSGQIPAITTDFSQFSAAFINSLNTQALQAITTTQLNKISSTTLSQLDYAHLSALSPVQVSSMKNLGGLSSAQFGLLNISQMSASAISALSQTEYQGLTALQISTLMPAQIKAMLHTSWMPDIAASAFTADQVQNISISMSWFTAGWLNNLSTTAFQAMTATQIGQISAANLSALDNVHIAALTAGQIAGITTSFSCFSAAALNSMNTTAFQAISATQLNNISTANLAALDNAHLSALTAAQVSAMTHLTSLSSDQFGLLDISALPVSAITGWTQTQYAGLSAQQMSTLSAAQISAMTHVDWLSPSAACGVVPAQMQYLGNRLSQLSSAFLNNLSIPAFEAISGSQFSAMTPAAIAGLDPLHIATLTSQLVSINADDLLSIAPLLTPAQLNLLSQSQQTLLSTSATSASSLMNSISDSGLKSILQTAAMNNHSLFSFGAIETVLKNFAASLTSGLTAAQYSDLTQYVQNIGSVCGTGSSIYSVVNGMVTGANGASVDWASASGNVRIGNLGAGSSGTQFNQLLSTWLDGQNAPQGSTTNNVMGRPLFANQTATINDIHQGVFGDCYLLAPLMAIANTTPDYLKSMIVQNTNDTYSVRFFNKGIADWVTVDNNTYQMGESSDNSSWGATIERAYETFSTTYLGGDNNYSTISGGSITTLQQITGDVTSSFRAASYTEAAWNSTVFDSLKAAVVSGEPAEIESFLSTKDAANGNTDFVSGHMLAITGFDAATNNFIVANPWGADTSGSYNGIFEASMDQLWEGGVSTIGYSHSNGASGIAGQLINAMATVTPVSAAPLVTASALLSNTNAGLVASHA